MLSENIYVNKEGIDIKKVSTRNWAFTYQCSKCGLRYLITKYNIDDFITSDPHDPLEDFIMCPNCDTAKGLFNGVTVKSNGIDEKLFGDGSYVYLTCLGENERIL